MATPGDLSSKKVKNTYKGIVQYGGTSHQIYDGTGSRIDDVSVTRITASNASIAHIQDLQHLSASSVTIDKVLAVSGSTYLGDECGVDKVKIVGDTWITGSLTVSGSPIGSAFRNIGQAKFIYLDNPGIEDQRPAKVTRGMVKGTYNVPRFGGEVAALDVYGNAVITGSLIVTDTVFAQEFHSEVVSQSIIFTSGSTKFGGDFNDTMTVTGSIFQSGSDSYFLNGIGLGTTGSQKGGTFDEAGQDNPVNFTHLLRIDDPGHNGLQYKNGKLMYASYGSPGASAISASDTIRIRDYSAGTDGDDILVISHISKSVFFTTNDEYNVGIGVPSGSNSQVDENLVVSSSTNARTKIESATAITSASLYLQSGRGVWELATTSGSTGANNQFSGSLVFRTGKAAASNGTAWSGNNTYTEAMRFDKIGNTGFNIPSINSYQYPQQVQISGSLNIIQGRTININSGSAQFHDEDGINGIYFNNQKMIYVSGSGATTSYFFGYDAGGTDAATGGHSNIGIGYQAGKQITTGANNVLIGENAGDTLTTAQYTIVIGHSAGGGNLSGNYNTLIGAHAGAVLTVGAYNNLIGVQSGNALLDSDYNVALGYQTLYTAGNGADKQIAIGYQAMKTGIATGDENIAIGSLALEDLTTGTDNVALGSSAGLNLTSAANTIAIGHDAIGAGILTGTNNTAIGQDSGKALTAGFENIFIGSMAGTAATDNENNIAIGHDAFAASANGGDKNVAIGYGAMKTGDVSGADNIAIGDLALEDLTSGANNVAIGPAAGLNITTANGTVAIGSQAIGSGITIGINNIAIGTTAGRVLTSGQENIFIGTGAGISATDNKLNIAIGHDALAASANDGDKNIAIGFESMATGDVSGIDNIAVGSKTLEALTTGDSNIAVGSGSMGIGAVTGNDNIAIGNFALEDTTSGRDNIAVGSGSMTSATDNVGNIAIGYETLKTSINDGDRNVAIGYQAMKTGDVSGDNNIAIGELALEDLTSGTDNVVIGSGAGLQVTDNTDNVVIGHDAFAASINDGDKNVAIGLGAMKTGDVSGDNNIAVGELSLEDLTTGTDNIAVGSSAGLNLTTAANTIAIGHDAIGVGIATGDNNIAIGAGALEDVTTASGSIAIGHGAAKQHTTSNGNIAIGSGSMGIGVAVLGNLDGQNIGVGSYALQDLTTGQRNVAIGYRALDELTTGGKNIAIGDQAMALGTTTGDNNIAIGKLAMNSAVGANYNIAIGYRALRDATNTAARNIIVGNETAFAGVFNGLDNIIMGTQAARNATTLDQNVIIGYHAVSSAGTAATGDRNVILGVSASAKLTSGADNTIIGPYAGGNITTNTNNILIGNRPSASAGLDNAYAIGNQALVTQADSMVLGGQTGERFSVGIGGMTAPNATLEVSGTVNITGSLIISASGGSQAGLTHIGTAVFTGSIDPASSWPSMRAMEVSGTSNFQGNTYITGNLYVTDIIVAQEFHTEFVSASITYSSGSNKIGDTIDDIQQITGSFRVSGSGPHYFTPGDFSASAKLGINTATPTYELDVVGNIGVGTLSDASNSVHSYVYHNDDTDTHLKLSQNLMTIAAGGYMLVVSGSGAADNGVIVNHDSQDMNFRVAGQSAIGINGGALSDTHLLFVSGGAILTEDGGDLRGAVGIRTSNPTVALTVSGSISASNDLFVEGNAIFGTSTVVISGSGEITSSGHLWVSGTQYYVSASGISASRGITTGGDILPYNNDGGVIGNATNQWSDLFLAEGGIINWDNGDFQARQVGNRLFLEGGKTRVERLEIDGSSDYIDQDASSNLEIIAGVDIILDPAGNNVLPGGDSEDDLGVAGTAWRKLFVDDIDLDGQGRIDLDNDQDTSIRASANNIITLEVGGTDRIHISASAIQPGTTNLYNLGYGGITAPKYFKHAYVNNITGSWVSASKGIYTSGHITASGNISASGYISSSHFAGISASFDNLIVTQSTSNPNGGSGSFGYVYAHTVYIHNHEIVGGQGLSVYGQETNLGNPGTNTQPTMIHGNLTGSNAWFDVNHGGTGVGGNISASTMTLTNNLTIQGNISSSWISASKGVWTAGEYSGSSLHVENGISGSYISASTGIWTAGSVTASVVTASNIYSSADVSGSFISASKGLYSHKNIFAGSHITASGNISASGIVYGMSGVSGSYISASKEFYTAGHVTASGNISASFTSTGSFGRLEATSVTASVISATTISASAIFTEGTLSSQNYRSLYIVAAGMTPNETNGASTDVEEVVSGNSYHAFDYIAFHNTTQQYANFQISMPSEWDRGAMRAKFYWKLTAGTATTDDVVWGIGAIAVGDDEELDGALTSYTDAPADTQASGDVTKLAISEVTPDITVVNAQEDTDHDLLFFRVTRQVGSDNYGAPAKLLGVSLQYQERSKAEVLWT